MTVLHTLRLVGVVDTERLCERIEIPEADLERRLAALERTDLVRRSGGSLPGWALTEAGRSRGAELLSVELDDNGWRPRVEHAYGEFLELNGGVLTVCTDWQVRAGSDPMILNDHCDSQYDDSVLGRLGILHSQAARLLDSLSSEMDRFALYSPRLSKALESARRGGLDWVTKPVIDSYHTVWFELHEDLLATLGRSRSDESAGRNDSNPA